jgi:hypothetical protein
MPTRSRYGGRSPPRERYDQHTPSGGGRSSPRTNAPSSYADELDGDGRRPPPRGRSPPPRRGGPPPPQGPGGDRYDGGSDESHEQVGDDYYDDDDGGEYYYGESEATTAPAAPTPQLATVVATRAPKSQRPTAAAALTAFPQLSGGTVSAPVYGGVDDPATVDALLRSLHTSLHDGRDHRPADFADHRTLVVRATDTLAACEQLGAQLALDRGQRKHDAHHLRLAVPLDPHLTRWLPLAALLTRCPQLRTLQLQCRQPPPAVAAAVGGGQRLTAAATAAAANDCLALGLLLPWLFSLAHLRELVLDLDSLWQDDALSATTLACSPSATRRVGGGAASGTNGQPSPKPLALLLHALDGGADDDDDAADADDEQAATRRVRVHFQMLPLRTLRLCGCADLTVPTVYRVASTELRELAVHGWQTKARQLLSLQVVVPRVRLLDLSVPVGELVVTDRLRALRLQRAATALLSQPAVWAPLGQQCTRLRALHLYLPAQREPPVSLQLLADLAGVDELCLLWQSTLKRKVAALDEPSLRRWLDDDTHWLPRRLVLSSSLLVVPCLRNLLVRMLRQPPAATTTTTAAGGPDDEPADDGAAAQQVVEVIVYHQPDDPPLDTKVSVWLQEIAKAEPQRLHQVLAEPRHAFSQ